MYNFQDAIIVKSINGLLTDHICVIGIIEQGYVVHCLSNVYQAVG